MEGKLKDDYSFRTGSVRYHDLAYIVAADDDLTKEDVPHTIFFTFDAGEWGHELKKWSSLSICVCQFPKDQMVAIGEHGNVYILGSGDDFEEVIGTGINSPEKRGPLREVRNIGGKAYAVGMDRQVYRRDAPGLWICIDAEMRKSKSLDSVFGFESIHGFNEKEIYAVGWHGEIWHFDGTFWNRKDSPTNFILTRAYCAPDGRVYIAGQNGLLLRGRRNEWETVPQTATRSDIWDVQWFNDKLYLSTTKLIYTLEGDDLEMVDTGEDIPSTCYHLDAADGILWSIGAKDILQYNGVEWIRIE